MKKLILFTLILFLTPLQARAGLLKELTLDSGVYTSLLMGPQKPMVAPLDIERVQYYDLGMDLNLVPKFLVWENNVITTTDKEGFRTVGWKWKINFQVLNNFSLYFQHHSHHVLDKKFEGKNENKIGFKWVIFKED